MLDSDDEAFIHALDQVLHRTLAGDDKVPGLYQAILSAQNWDEYHRMRSEIRAYEAVRKEMRAIVQRMNGERQARQPNERIMN